MAVSLGVLLSIADRVGSLITKLRRDGRTEATDEEMDAATERMDDADQNLDDALNEAENRDSGG